MDCSDDAPVNLVDTQRPGCKINLIRAQSSSYREGAAWANETRLICKALWWVQTVRWHQKRRDIPMMRVEKMGLGGGRQRRSGGSRSWGSRLRRSHGRSTFLLAPMRASVVLMVAHLVACSSRSYVLEHLEDTGELEPEQVRSALAGSCGDGVWDPLLEECDFGGATLGCSAQCSSTPYAVDEDGNYDSDGSAAGVLARYIGNEGVAAGSSGVAVAVSQIELPNDTSAASNGRNPIAVVVNGFEASGERAFETTLVRAGWRSEEGVVGTNPWMTPETNAVIAEWGSPYPDPNRWLLPSLAWMQALPVSAAGPAQPGGYLVAWPVFTNAGVGSEWSAGDELDVGLAWLDEAGALVDHRLVQGVAEGGPATAGDADFAQYSPSTLVSADGSITVAWLDDGLGPTAPDLKYRRFQRAPSADGGFVLSPSTEPTVLSDTPGVEGSATLTEWGQSWVAAFRVGQDNGRERVVVIAPDEQRLWVLPEALPAPGGDEPAVVAIDEDTLMVFFTVAVPVQDSVPGAGEASSFTASSLKVALLNEGTSWWPTASGTDWLEDAPSLAPLVPICDLPADGDVGTAVVSPALVPEAAQFFAFGSPSRYQPSAKSLGWQATLSWTVDAALQVGSNEGPQSAATSVWRRAVSWDAGIDACTELSFGKARGVSTTSDGNALGADSDASAVAYGAGTEVIAWQDHTPKDFASAVSQSDEAELAEAWTNPVVPNVRLGVAPVDTYCSPASPCSVGEGHCTTDADCAGALMCGYHNGAAFGFRSSLNVCISCGNGVVEVGEQCDTSVQTPECNANCTTTYCGDGLVHPSNEQCDPGAPGVNTATCTAQCTNSACGDGYVNPAAGEACEPAVPGMNSATCDANCTLPACGDGVLNAAAGESCELTDPNCTASCAVVSCGPSGCPHIQTRVSSVAPTDNVIHPVIRLVNQGTTAINLSGYTVKYWFDEPWSGGWQVSHYYNLSVINETQTTVTQLPAGLAGANTVVTVALEGTLPASTFVNGQMQTVGEAIVDIQWNHPNWSNLNENNDYSYPVTRTTAQHTQFLENPKVTLYKQGVRIWGTEPANAAICGNSIVEYGETCDTGGQSAMCDANCTAVSCGDGTLNTSAGEVCDPGIDSSCLSNCSGVVTACTSSNTCLHVQVARFNGDSLTDQSVRYKVNVVNSGATAVNLNQLTVRYWLTNESAGSWLTYCDYAAMSGGCASVNTSIAPTTLNPAPAGASLAWIVGFSSAQVLNPGQSTGEIQLRSHSSLWGNLNEADDYSRPVNTSFAPATRIGLYKNGTLVWGDDP